ncbi:hypothetical protein D3C75_229550 [compost metagenome]
MHEGSEQQLVAAEVTAFRHQIAVNAHVHEPFIKVTEQGAVVQLPVRLGSQISFGPVRIGYCDLSLHRPGSQHMRLDCQPGL